MSDADAATPSKARMRWLCRRGMKELDVLLERYFAAEFDRIDVAAQTHFHDLLQLEDPELYAYLMGRATPEQPALAALVADIRDYRAG